jgi:hypothetical protein
MRLYSLYAIIARVFLQIPINSYSMVYLGGKLMKKGDLVMARTHSDGVVTRRVVEVTPKTVYICREEEWQAALGEKREPQSVGFKREFVRGKA